MYKNNNLSRVIWLVNIFILLQTAENMEQGRKIFLINAVKQQNLETIRWLLNEQAAVDIQDNEGKTALMHAVSMSNSSEMAKIILQAGANQYMKDNDGSTALHIAVHKDSLEMLNLFSYNTSKINTKDNQGNTPLHAAVTEGNENVVSYLLDNGLDPYDENNQGLTAVHIAAINGKTSILQLLKNKGKDLDIMTNGNTPLMLAILHQQKSAIEFLVVTGANITRQNNSFWSPLHVAASTGNLQIIELVKDNGTNINAKNLDGHTPLYLAVERGHYIAAKYLIKEGADTDIIDIDGNNLLHAAASSGNLEMLGYFASSIHLDGTNNNGTTPLIVAAKRGNMSAAELLIKYGANVNILDKNGMSFLIAAVKSSNLDFLVHIDKLYGNISYDVTDLEGATPLHYASKRDDVDLAHFIINSMTEEHYLKHQEFQIRSKRTLHYKLKFCPLCYKNVTNIRDHNGRTASYYAAEKGNAEILDLLVRYGGNFSITDNNGLLPLHAAALSTANLDTLNLVTVMSPDIDKKDHDGKTALFLSAEAGQIETLKYLIDVGANVLITDNQGWTIMHAAAAKGHTTIILELELQQKSMINTIDVKGRTPAWYALSMGHMDTHDKLISIGAEVKPVFNVFKAAEKGEINIINYLFTKCDSPLGRNNKGQTLMHVAAEAGQTLVIKELGNYKCLINNSDNMTRTPAWYALYGEHWDSLKLLKQLGAVIKPKVSITQVIMAGRLNTVKYLMNKGNDDYLKGNLPPIHTAIQAGQYEIVKFLLESETDFYTKINNFSPLRRAIHNNYCNIAKLLLDKGVRDNTVEEERGVFGGIYCHDILRRYGYR